MIFTQLVGNFTFPEFLISLTYIKNYSCFIINNNYFLDGDDELCQAKLLSQPRFGKHFFLINFIIKCTKTVVSYNCYSIPKLK